MALTSSGVTTIELNNAMQALGDHIDGKFTELEKRIDQRFVAIDQRFDGIEKRFVAIDQRFDRIEKRFVAIDQRFDRIERMLYLLMRAAGLEFDTIDDARRE